MECHFCGNPKSTVYTPCCIKPVCSLCALDFKDAKCPCDNMQYRESFHLVKFSKIKIKIKENSSLTPMDFDYVKQNV